MGAAPEVTVKGCAKYTVLIVLCTCPCACSSAFKRFFGTCPGTWLCPCHGICLCPCRATCLACKTAFSEMKNVSCVNL